MFWIPDNLVSFCHQGLTRFLEWLLDFVQDVLAHDVIIQLALAFTVQTESTNFTFHVTLVGLVAIILGSTRHEFFNVVVGVQFAREFAEVIPQDWVGLTLVLQDNHGVSRGPVPQVTLRLRRDGVEPNRW